MTRVPCPHPPHRISVPVNGRYTCLQCGHEVPRPRRTTTRVYEARKDETETERYVVTQSPPSGAWTHYFGGWFGGVPHWDSYREAAKKLDEQTARQLVEKFDVRYRGAVLHRIEEL